MVGTLTPRRCPSGEWPLQGIAMVQHRTWPGGSQAVQTGCGQEAASTLLVRADGRHGTRAHWL